MTEPEKPAQDIFKLDPMRIWNYLVAKPPVHDIVKKLHEKADKDGGPKSLHHTLGPTANQAASGDHTHDGGNSARLDDLMGNITVTGSRGGNAALASLLTQLANEFGLTDNSSA